MWDKIKPKLERQLARYQELERLLADEAVVADRARYTALAKEYGSLGRLVSRFKRYKELDQALTEARQLAEDAELGDMAEEEIARVAPEVEAAEKELVDEIITADEADHDSIIMEIRAGTGGDEAALFARDLCDMYRRYAESRGWKVEMLDASVSDQRGFKEVSFSIAGEGAYRALKFESGGHRVQRVPETETQGRIHTSAATVAVMAEPEEVEVDIRPEDIEMEAIRSSGPGGQHVNKTSSAVRLTHVPTGLVVLCQDERSQHKNRSKAMRLLRSRLFDMFERKKHSERASLRKSLIGSGDRSERIRTYNFPQNRCTDHRIGENFNLEPIIAGSLDKLVAALGDYERGVRLDALAEEM